MITPRMEHATVIVVVELLPERVVDWGEISLLFVEEE